MRLLIEKLGEAHSMLEVTNGVQKIASIFELLKDPPLGQLMDYLGSFFYFAF